MTERKMTKKYDLEERTFLFARKCADFIRKLPRTISNIEYGRQLIRSSGSVASNYIEANEALSKKDFVHRIKICRKEAKESRLWLRLIDISTLQDVLKEKESLAAEAEELKKIFSSIVDKSS